MYDLEMTFTLMLFAKKGDDRITLRYAGRLQLIIQSETAHKSVLPCVQS
jgi:hypothetical protein